MRKINLFLFIAVFVLFAGFAGVVEAADDIEISSATITSANTVMVLFEDPGDDLDSVDATKWHLDENTDGEDPLDPTSAVVTTEGAPWRVTLTFAGTPFADTATSFNASHGLYVDAGGVTDEDDDTNEVVGDEDSMAIDDGQAPTFTALRTALNTIVLIFSEDVTGTAIADSFTVVGASAVTNTAVTGSTAITLTTTGLTDLNVAANVGYSASTGDVEDEAGNEVANGGSVTSTPPVPGTPGGKGVSCPPGHMFKVQTGERCTSSTVFCPPGHMFNGETGERCNVASNPTAPGASGYTFGSATVKQGTTGEDCKGWQMFLNAKKNAGLVVDGNCGPKTMGAAKAWQASKGLVADGLLGPASRGKAMMQ